MLRCSALVSCLLLASVGPGFASGLTLYEAVPQALGMGQAYTALARGPLAALWNPAGIGKVPGLQGAVAVAFSSDGDILLFGGGSLAGAQAPAIAWTVAKGEDGRELLGTLSLPILPDGAVGGGVSFVSQTKSSAVSFNAGILLRGETWSLGASLFHFGAEILGTSLPVRLQIGASLLTAYDVLLGLDLHYAADAWRVAIGARARAWGIDVHWGTSVILDGGLSHIGLGVGFSLFGLPADLSVGLVGTDLQPWASGSVEGALLVW